MSKTTTISPLLIEKNLAEQWAGTRIDRLLQNIYSLNFTQIQKLLREKEIKVNNIKTDGSYRLKIGDIIYFSNYFANLVASNNSKNNQNSVKDLTESRLAELYQNFLQWIIYQDQDIVAINKPEGVAVQGGSKIRWSIADLLKYQNRYNHNYASNLADLSLKQDPLQKKLTDLADRWQLVHRLDKDTSGILLIAKNRQSAEKLTAGFRNKTIVKTYLAVVSGKFKDNFKIINLPLLKTNIGGEEKVVVDNKNGKEACSKFYFITNYLDYSLLALQPISGRTHQLRVHCQAINYPIVNDKKYCKKDNLNYFMNRQVFESKMCLNAHLVTIKNYKNGQDLTIKNPNLPFFLKYFNLSKDWFNNLSIDN